MIAMKLLKVLDCISVLMEQASHHGQNGYIGGSVKSAPPGSLHRADEGEFGLPKSQNVLSYPDLFSGFGNGPKRLGALRQDQEPLL
jgi:hypothetical protein